LLVLLGVARVLAQVRAREGLREALRRDVARVRRRRRSRRDRRRARGDGRLYAHGCKQEQRADRDSRGTRASRRVVRAGRTLRRSLRLGAAMASAGACPLMELVSVSTGRAPRRVGLPDDRSSPRARDVGRRCRRRLYDEGGPGRPGRPDRVRAHRRGLIAGADGERDRRRDGERRQRRQGAPPAAPGRACHAGTSSKPSAETGGQSPGSTMPSGSSSIAIALGADRSRIDA
jgi:hypothetical protein